MPSTRTVPFNCVHCGKPFLLPASVAKRRPDHACSLSCARAHWPNKKRKGATLQCELCNKDFYVVASRATDRRMARFCSDACKNEFQQGENHPNWKGRGERPWAWRQVIIDRMKFVKNCEMCGESEGLCGHHIKPTSTHPELGAESTNIIILCTPCHAKQHPEQEGLILSAIRAYGT